jgi:hypothetical protein
MATSTAPTFTGPLLTPDSRVCGDARRIWHGGIDRPLSRPRSRSGPEATGEWLRACTEEVPRRAAQAAIRFALDLVEGPNWQRATGSRPILTGSHTARREKTPLQTICASGLVDNECATRRAWDNRNITATAVTFDLSPATSGPAESGSLARILHGSVA